MKSISRPWISVICLSTSGRERPSFCSVIRALKASMPPYIAEYRGGFPPLRMSGKCFSASSSHVVTCATISLTDHAPVTPRTSNCESERPVCDSWKSFQALSSRPKRWCLSTKSFTRYDAYLVCRSPEQGELRILLLNSNAAFSRNRTAERQLRCNTRFACAL